MGAYLQEDAAKEPCLEVCRGVPISWRIERTNPFPGFLGTADKPIHTGICVASNQYGLGYVWRVEGRNIGYLGP